MSHSQLNFAQGGYELARALLRYHHRKVFGFRRERHDGAKWDRDGRMWNFTKTDRSNHAWFQMTVAIAHGHFNGKDSVLYVGSRGDACNPPLHRSGIILCLDPQLLPETTP